MRRLSACSTGAKPDSSASDWGTSGLTTKVCATQDIALRGRVDSGSIFNGDSYKGFEYKPTRPEHVLPSLDHYRISDQDRDHFGGWLVYKPLKDNWYLYLFVSG
jgi:hypothetical protein